MKYSKATHVEVSLKAPHTKRLMFGVEMQTWKPSPTEEQDVGHPRGCGEGAEEADERISGQNRKVVRERMERVQC